MRLVLDTNVVLSGFLWRGAPYKVLEIVHRGEADFFCSPPMITELESVLNKPKFAKILYKKRIQAPEVIEWYQSICQIVAPALVYEQVCSDPGDQAVIECAISAEADVIVSGDHHLLDLGTFQGIRILTAKELVVLSSRK